MMLEFLLGAIETSWEGNSFIGVEFCCVEPKTFERPPLAMPREVMPAAFKKSLRLLFMAAVQCEIK
jgi:hypothetical protein